MGGTGTGTPVVIGGGATGTQAPYALIQGALDSTLASFASTYATMLVAYEGINFTEPDPEDGWPWVRPTFFPDDAPPVSIGLNPLIRRIGRYQIDLFWPASTGAGAASPATCADVMLGTFKAGTTITAGSYKVQLTRAERANGRDDEGGWYHIPVKIEWECYTPNNG